MFFYWLWSPICDQQLTFWGHSCWLYVLFSWTASVQCRQSYSCHWILCSTYVCMWMHVSRWGQPWVDNVLEMTNLKMSVPIQPDSWGGPSEKTVDCLQVQGPFSQRFSGRSQLSLNLPWGILVEKWFRKFLTANLSEETEILIFDRRCGWPCC